MVAEMANQADMPKQRLWWLCVWGLCLGALLLIVAGVWFMSREWAQTSGHPDWANPGIRGDFFGGHFAATSGLAGVFLLLAAVLIQRNELSLQRFELIKAREISQQQAEALERQTKELELQNRLSQGRDDMQLIMLMPEKLTRLQATSAGKKYTPLLRIALISIVRQAQCDKKMGLELLDFFQSSCKFLSKQECIDQVKDIVNTYAPELMLKSEENALPWLDEAEHFLWTSPGDT